MGDVADNHADRDPRTLELELQVAELRSANRALERLVASQRTQIHGYQEVEGLLATPVKVPKWARKPAKKREDRHATAVAILSDCHFDEVVNPDEIGGLNAYNRPIADARLDRFFNRIPWLAKDHLNGLSYDGLVLLVGGDLISGDIHDELRETNETHSTETVLYWSERIASGIKHLADEFGRVHIPWIVGNHGRRTKKPRAKGRVRDNFDWMMGRLVAGALSSDERITFDIPDSTDAYIPIYDYTILATHGDQARGGGGVGGIWPPIKRLRGRKLERYTSADMPFDLLAMGHWHQLLPPADGLCTNGSLKGADEWSTGVMNFPPEPAQQLFFTVVPTHGVTWSAPIRCQDRKAEGW